MDASQLKKFMLVAMLLTLAACGVGGNLASDQAEEAATPTVTGLALTPAASTIVDGCKLETIDGRITTSEESRGVEGGPETASSRFGVYLELSANQNLELIFSDYLRTYSVSAQDQVFQVLASDGSVKANVNTHLLSRPNGQDTNSMEMVLNGLSADGTDQDYELIIPAGSVTCADGTRTQTDFTVAFTVTGIPGTSIVSSDDSQTTQAATETEFTVSGEETSDCYPLNIEGTSQTIYSENDGEPTLGLELIMNQRDVRFAWPVGWRDIDAAKISLTDANGIQLNVEASVQEMTAEFVQTDYMNFAAFEFVGLTEKKGTYTLTLSPGALVCVDDESTFENTATYQASISVGQLSSCAASDGVDADGNDVLSNVCESN